MYRTFGPDKDGMSYTVFGSHIIPHKGVLSALNVFDTQTGQDWVRVTFNEPTINGRNTLVLDRELWEQWKVQRGT